MTTNDRRIALAETAKDSRGRTMFLKHLHGERLTQREAILAKCFDCNAGYPDGRGDCRMSHCPLYPFSPYREEKK